MYPKSHLALHIQMSAIWNFVISAFTSVFFTLSSHDMNGIYATVLVAFAYCISASWGRPVLGCQWDPLSLVLDLVLGHTYLSLDNFALGRAGWLPLVCGLAVVGCR